ncbi:MAG: hypothetical protein LBL72_06770 [Candidatus Accumulibacter sp.]|jgi:hypothetical protein|nr:hypothetical protein [Accumulibacter sp.]
MDRKALDRLWWRIRRVRRIAWPAWLALSLVLISAFFACAGLRIEKESRDLLAADGVVRATSPRRATRTTPENALQAYYAVLPDEEERFILLKRVLLSAREQGIFPPQADYRLEGEAMTKVGRYRLSLALYGRFSDVQDFLVDVLNENRSIAVDSISVRRESPEKAEVEVRLQFSILMTKS